VLEDRIDALRDDRRRGSGALGDEALAILGLAAEQAPPGEGFLEALGEVALRLAHARPGMVALENRVHQVMANLHAAEAHPAALPGIAQGLVETLRAKAEQERLAAARVAAQAVEEARILTVSWSDTTAKAFEALAARRPVVAVLPAGAPLGDGLRAAERLALAGAAVEVVPDNALGWAALRCDAALVGADAVLADGTVVNRAGTLLAALAMALARKPLWVACELAKVTWRDALPLEEGLPGDVGAPSPLLPIVVKHPLFDATPAALVNGYCTEAGVLQVQDLAAVARRHRARAAWMEP
jgi:ribose 1,5-bisphosphate isomerase